MADAEPLRWPPVTGRERVLPGEPVGGVPSGPKLPAMERMQQARRASGLETLRLDLARNHAWQSLTAHAL